MSGERVAVESRDLPLTILDRPLLDARIDRDEEQMEELTRDIARRGIIYPLIVVCVGDRYEIVDGYSRFLCAQRACLAVVPCRIYPSKETALEGVKYAANMYRLEMSPCEEAIMFNELLGSDCGDDIERLCALTGRRLSYVDARLALLRGGEDVFAALARKEIGVGVAEELNKITDPHYRTYYLQHAIRSGATRAVVSSWWMEWRQLFGGAPAPAAPAAAVGPALADGVASPFTCVICGKADNVHLIRQIDIHQHCKLAILDPLLEQARGGPSGAE